ncbi:hypothetical protein ES703_102290 [subsurface metagenome]
MLAQKGVLVPGQAKGVLVLSAAGKDLPGLKGQKDGIGGVAPRPPQRPRLALFHHVDAVVVAGVDIAVMQQEIVGDAL